MQSCPTVGGQLWTLSKDRQATLQEHHQHCLCLLRALLASKVNSYQKKANVLKIREVEEVKSKVVQAGKTAAMNDRWQSHYCNIQKYSLYSDKERREARWGKNWVTSWFLLRNSAVSKKIAEIGIQKETADIGHQELPSPKSLVFRLSLIQFNIKVFMTLPSATVAFFSRFYPWKKHNLKEKIPHQNQCRFPTGSLFHIKENYCEIYDLALGNIYIMSAAERQWVTLQIKLVQFQTALTWRLSCGHSWTSGTQSTATSSAMLTATAQHTWCCHIRQAEK